jgi:hypothetical protein
MTDRLCAYCNSAGPLTKEHFWPAALHRRLIGCTDDKQNCFWLRKINREIKGEPTIRDVCAECNNVKLSVLDSYICELFDRFFVCPLERHEEVQFEFDYHRLKRWLLKMCFNSARVHSAIDLFVFPPLVPYINGENQMLGRSVQLYVQLDYPVLISDSATLQKDGSKSSFLFRPTAHRVGHAWFNVPGVGKKLLRAVHLRAFSFFLAFFEKDEAHSAHQDFMNEFLTRMSAMQLLRPSRPNVTLICNGCDAWQSFSNARENILITDRA